MKSHDHSSYVFDYLMINKDLPRDFRKMISKIIDNLDPFDMSVNFSKNPPIRTEVVINKSIWDEFDESDDIPW